MKILRKLNTSVQLTKTILRNLYRSMQLTKTEQSSNLSKYLLWKIQKGLLLVSNKVNHKHKIFQKQRLILNQDVTFWKAGRSKSWKTLIIRKKCGIFKPKSFQVRKLACLIKKSANGITTKEKELGLKLQKSVKKKKLPNMKPFPDHQKSQ